MFDCDGRLLRIAAAIDELVEEELDPSSTPPQSDLLLGLLEQMDRLEAEVVRRTGAWDRAGDWALEGAVTPAAWLRAGAARRSRGDRAHPHGHEALEGSGRRRARP